jgi:hypothetical protein
VMRVTHLVLLLGLLTLIATHTCWNVLSALLQTDKVIHAFDDSFLATEPFQISDLRAALAQAQVLISRNDWAVSLRLLRDCRNQWEMFVPVMRTAYATYAWSEKDIQQTSSLWNGAVNAAQRKNAEQANRALRHLENLMNKYRVRSISRVA